MITPESGVPVTLEWAFSVFNVPGCQYTVGFPPIAFGPNGGTGTMGVLTRTHPIVPWTANTGADWITLAQPIQDSPTSWHLFYSVAPNPGVERSATIAFLGQFGIQQLRIFNQAAACTYSVSPSLAVAPTGGGPAEFTVSTGSGCAWSESYNTSWITSSMMNTSTGSGTVTYLTAPSRGATRLAIVTIAGQRVKIIQPGPPSKIGIFRSGLWVLNHNGDENGLKREQSLLPVRPIRRRPSGRRLERRRDHQNRYFP